MGLLGYRRLTGLRSGNAGKGCRRCSGYNVRRISNQSFDVLDTEGYVPLCDEGRTHGPPAQTPPLAVLTQGS